MFIGEYSFADGRNSGEWKNDGKGVFEWPDGQVYEGNWKEDEYSGLGSMIYSDGGTI